MKTFQELYDENGNYITDSRYTEIKKLHDMLTESKVPHVFHKLMDGWQVIYPEDGPFRVMDTVEHFGSYGSSDDLLEIMGLLTPEEAEVDSVIGNLSAIDVFDRIYRHWNDKDRRSNLIHRLDSILRLINDD